jgi:hypothetical protein
VWWWWWWSGGRYDYIVVAIGRVYIL